jgi:hypothetical protein
MKQWINLFIFKIHLKEKRRKIKIRKVRNLYFKYFNIIGGGGNSGGMESEEL